jgi:hypothetical protein
MFGYHNECTYLYRTHNKSLTSTINYQELSLTLAKCRSKAVKLNKFQECSLDVQWKVFFDLLIVHLAGFPERQSDIINSREFIALPWEMQANLLRLMASNAILTDVDQGTVKRWLEASHNLIPSEKYTALLKYVYRSSSLTCKLLIKTKRLFSKKNTPYPIDATNKHA